MPNQYDGDHGMSTIRFCAFNCENLFSRPWIMDLATWEDGRPVLEDIQRLNELLNQSVYTDEIKVEIAAILEVYRFNNRNITPDNRPFIIHEVRDKLFSVSRDGIIKIVASGRADWVGWVELSREEFNEVAMTNTGRVIQKVNADVQLLVEAEDRWSIELFNRQLLGETLQMQPYGYNLLVDGNDARGIDIGLLSRHKIQAVHSHISDVDAKGVVFSRDCPEFEVILPSGESLWVLGNHFKSKGFGNAADNNRKRKRQAERVKAIYEEARRRSDLVIVAGDLNDTPGSDPLKPLLEDTDLRDVMTHPSYSGLAGTYDTCTPANKIDYVLLSPALWERVLAVGVERSGIWAPRAFAAAGIEIMETVTSDLNSASDHAAVWVDLDL